MNESGSILGGVGGLVLGIVALGLLGNTGMFGGNNNSNGMIQNEFTQSAISDLNTNVNNGFMTTNSNLYNGFGRVNDNICDTKQSVVVGDMGLQNIINTTSNQTQRDVLSQTNELNTTLLTTAFNAQNTALTNQNIQNQNALNSLAKQDECCCRIESAIRTDGEATRALITQNTIQDLRDRLSDAQNTITANAVSSNVINSIRPYPTPSWLVSSPYTSIYNPYGYPYNNGFYGNTLV